jgi:hypothetical protein
MGYTFSPENGISPDDMARLNFDIQIVLEAYVSPTLEAMVTVDPIAMRRGLILKRV